MPQQLTFPGDLMASADLATEPRTDRGEVFTRRWIVEIILDLIGYTADRDLAPLVLLEPSCGTGAFLVPAVERLLDSAKAHGRDIQDLGSSIRAFDLFDANTDQARRAISQVLVDHGFHRGVTEATVRGWINTGDFLLEPVDSDSVDFVVGNPPYIRLENVSPQVMDRYRQTHATMRGRSDIYVGFIERGLDLLKPEGTLSFICADRWMRNQYGADLRELVAGSYAVDTVISMHDVDAFEDDVSAYPAIIVLRNGEQGRATVAEAKAGFGDVEASRLLTWKGDGRCDMVSEPTYEATRVDGWFSGRDFWPSGSPSRLALLADLESRFPPIEESGTGTRVSIGVATGCDDVFITDDDQLVESDRLLPLVQARDLTEGSVEWSGRYLVNPWSGFGLVELENYPRLRAYYQANRQRLHDRHIARQRPDSWYRTIDRVHPKLTGRRKLLLPDIKAAAHPVLDEGGHYPHHNLYYLVSDSWDLEVLGGILLSDITNLFVGAYCVKMRGGTYRFQAQYLRRIRVPAPDSIQPHLARSLATAFADRDHERATGISAQIYGVDVRSF